MTTSDVRTVLPFTVLLFGLVVHYSQNTELSQSLRCKEPAFAYHRLEGPIILLCIYRRLPERPVPAARYPTRQDGRDGELLARCQAIAAIAVALLLVTACGAPTPTEAPPGTQPPPTLAPISPTVTPVPPTPVPPTVTPAPPAAAPMVAPTKTRTASRGTQIELEPEPTVALTTVEEFRLQSDQFTVVGDLQIPNTEGR